jgi:Endomembrane protein 70
VLSTLSTRHNLSTSTSISTPTDILTSLFKVHGDVFRAPESLVLFSAMLGTGWQLLLLVFAVIVYAMAGKIFFLYRKQPGLPCVF